MKLIKNKDYEVKITDINNLGYGVAKIEGVTVFVSGGVTGDKCIVKLIKVNKTWCVGKLMQLLSPSSHRLKQPECNMVRLCGGCVFGEVNYEHEKEIKKNQVIYALRKAGLMNVTVADTMCASSTCGYRNKAQYPVGLTPDGTIRAGFYAPRTHRIVGTENCALQPPIFGKILQTICSFWEEKHLSVYDETTNTGILRHIYLRRGQATDQIMAAVVINAKEMPESDSFVATLRSSFPQIVSIGFCPNEMPGNVILDGKYTCLWGTSYIEDILLGKRFRISPLSFYQVNHDGADMLYRKAQELLQLTGEETVLDLYCGIGTIGISIASDVKRLIGVEIIPQAIENAKENAQQNGMTNASFFVGDAGQFSTLPGMADILPDVIIVDPPRKGLSAQGIADIAALSPQKIIYISCAADTFSRDLSIFATYGYHPGIVYPVDMFCRTGHVEMVCLLSKLCADHHIEVELNLNEMDLTASESKATYDEIKAYVLEHSGLEVSSPYISQVKRKLGLEVGANYNLPKSEESKQPQCPLDKVAAIMEALRHYKMI